MQFNPTQLHTLVIKIGTALLGGGQAFDGHVMESVVREVCRLKHGHDLNILLVSSGAVGCGMNALGMTRRPVALPEKQAVAAVGQAILMHYYQALFRTHGEGLHAAQVLLNLADLDERQSYLNVRNTLRSLFDMKTVVPIINENDSTAVQELCFGDNDTLAAKIAAKKSADLFIILSDVDGLYKQNPATHPKAELLGVVDQITPDIARMAGGAGTVASTGGMRTKIEAARIAHAAGVTTVIANGRRPGIIHGILEGTAPCTIFTPGKGALSHRKRWIAFGRTSNGTLVIDDGARNALLHQGTSLLAAGITAAHGDFDAGDAVEIHGTDGQAIARGLVNYSGTAVRRILGRKSGEIETILGRKDFDEVIHRDNLVLL